MTHSDQSESPRMCIVCAKRPRRLRVKTCSPACHKRLNGFINSKSVNSFRKAAWEA